ncbi:endonuclease NucS domain-containing protein [Paenibacillus sp. AN1007]|uniref:Endonuclease NucS domain-containing protein n=1 Tax=Paenibacillus sp. AN1007 TaxID=3151385 RepID=A0AAU8ND10_9BACL
MLAIKHGIWRVSGSDVRLVKNVTLDLEIELEEIIQSNPAVLDDNWLIIGRQVLTEFNTYIDLLAIDNSGSIIIIELKKHKTSREVVAQGLDYASWVKGLSASQISVIYESYIAKYPQYQHSLEDAYYNKFKVKLEEENINHSHQIVIVAAELDSSTERIVEYLSDSLIPINVIFFTVFEEDSTKYISRAWMIDPQETLDNASNVVKDKEPWNGEYYVSFGDGTNRSWSDALTYGFISGGGGEWYSRTLNQLSIGDRVWANIPSVGYVGVGTVTDTAKKADEVFFPQDGVEQTIYQLSSKANYFKEFLHDDDRAEFIVKVNWIQALPASAAVSEIGFFGNQNTVCKPRASKWVHTINRLKGIWHIQ